EEERGLSAVPANRGILLEVYATPHACVRESAFPPRSEFAHPSALRPSYPNPAWPQRPCTSTRMGPGQLRRRKRVESNTQMQLPTPSPPPTPVCPYPPSTPMAPSVMRAEAGADFGTQGNDACPPCGVCPPPPGLLGFVVVTIPFARSLLKSQRPSAFTLEEDKSSSSSNPIRGGGIAPW
ncbi:unnamed protein product, partial [Discosporangium mesarthrocarpum]